MAVRPGVGNAVGNVLQEAFKNINRGQQNTPAAQEQAQPNQGASQAAAAYTGGYSSGGGGGGGGGGAAAAPQPDAFSLTLPEAAAPFDNDLQFPENLPEGASDEQKANYWIAVDNWWTKETQSRLSYYNQARRLLAQAEANYPNATKDPAQAQAILNARIAVSEAEARFNEAKQKSDTIDVNVGVSTSKDGDNERVEKTYTITDDSGNTVSTKFSEDNGGMSASELRAKQERDQQKALDASNAAVAADVRKQVESIQAGAERDYAIGAAQSSLDAYLGQYNRNLEKVESDAAADRLEKNQDLLLASNETYSNAVNNSREAAQILSQYNLGGSSLGGRMNQIAANAANQSNQVSALTYNRGMREVDRNYGDARMELEDERAKQQNAFNQSKAQAEADYWSRLAAQAGKTAEEMSQYANPDYWYGTMFDNQGNRLNSYGNMNSEEMRSYADNQARRYNEYVEKSRYDQQQAAKNQTGTKADQYISNYTTPAAKTYETGLRSYKPVNSNNTVLGQTDLTQPKLEFEGESQL